MKKVICLVLLVVMLLTMLTACGKFECELCGEEKFGSKNQGEVLGMTITYCNDCKEGLKELQDMFG